MSKRTMKKRVSPTSTPIDKIPVVVICYNELTYIKNMVKQLEKYNHPIILIDNNSQYEPLLEYYKKIKSKSKDKIEIRLLNKNYGNTVYLTLKHTLPEVYILTDPDLQLNTNMPQNFAEILFEISERHKLYKVGLELEKINKEDFINCNSMFKNGQVKETRIKNDKYELYDNFVDTTFCLVNSKYRPAHLDLSKAYMDSTRPALRIAGDFTAKHLPWYKNPLIKIPQREFKYYTNHAKSSTLVLKCIHPKHDDFPAP